METKAVRFSNNNNSEFTNTLRSRVANFFSENKISTHANSAMILKSIILISAFILTYFSLFIFGTPGIGLQIILWIVLGLLTAGIGFSVMHDANHGAYSSSRLPNQLIGYSLNLIGGNVANWKIQHNQLHHFYTNIEGFDEDISNVAILRFSPHQRLKHIHRYQHIYAWPIYSLMTLSWVLWGDFVQLVRFRRERLLDKLGHSFWVLLVGLIISKLLYLGYALVLPLVLLDNPWYITVGLFMSMHLVTGFVLSVVFQVAHVMPTSEFPKPMPGTNLVETNWAIHQLKTTTNFAPNNAILTWLVGGLNHQIEHHLFPTICHIHYPKLAEIVQRTANEYRLPYHVRPTLTNALWHHGRMLRQLGRGV